MRNALAVLVAAILLVGCGAGRSRLVGTWEAKITPDPDSKGLVGAMQSMASSLIGGLTLEFNEEGKYKASVDLGATSTGTYTISGNEVRLTPEDSKGKAMTLVFDGDTLRAKKDFASDSDLVFTRKPAKQP